MNRDADPQAGSQFSSYDANNSRGHQVVQLNYWRSAFFSSIFTHAKRKRERETDKKVRER